MFSLVIALASLLLVALLLLASIFYLGESTKNARASGLASTLMNQAHQISGGLHLYYVDHGEYPPDLATMMTQDYLRDIPDPPPGLLAQPLPQLIEAAHAQAPTPPWEMLVPGRPTFLVREAVGEDVCRELNFRYRASDAIYRKVDNKSFAQCFGELGGPFTFIVGTTTGYGDMALAGTVLEYNESHDPKLPVVTPETPGNTLVAEATRGDEITPALAATDLPAATRGTEYYFDFTSLLSGGETLDEDALASTTWSIAAHSSLPAGLSLGLDGVLFGIPDNTEYLQFEVVASHEKFTISQSYTLPVHGMVSTVTQMAVGAGHGCGLRSNGQVACWGKNDAGQLGSGFVGAGTAATLVPELQGVVSVHVDGTTSCALRNDGALFCWGSNATGLIAGAPFTNHPAPVQVAIAGVVDKFEMDAGQACALVADSMKCWGRTGTGGSIRGVETFAHHPVQDFWVGGPIICHKDTGARYAYESTCKSTGTYSPPSSFDQDPSYPFKNIYTGASFSCIITDADTLHCDRNVFGTNASLVEWLIGFSASNVRSVALRTTDFLVVRKDGSAWRYWGEKLSGYYSPQVRSQRLMTGGVVAADVLGADYCLLGADGSVWCEGTPMLKERNGSVAVTGQLGKIVY